MFQKSYRYIKSIQQHPSITQYDVKRYQKDNWGKILIYFYFDKVQFVISSCVCTFVSRILVLPLPILWSHAVWRYSTTCIAGPYLCILTSGGLYILARAAAYVKPRAKVSHSSFGCHIGFEVSVNAKRDQRQVRHITTLIIEFRFALITIRIDHLRTSGSALHAMESRTVKRFSSTWIINS